MIKKLSFDESCTFLQKIKCVSGAFCEIIMFKTFFEFHVKNVIVGTLVSWTQKYIFLIINKFFKSRFVDFLRVFVFVQPISVICVWYTIFFYVFIVVSQRQLEFPQVIGLFRSWGVFVFLLRDLLYQFLFVFLQLSLCFLTVSVWGKSKCARFHCIQIHLTKLLFSKMAPLTFFCKKKIKKYKCCQKNIFVTKYYCKQNNFSAFY